jgi:mRNA-degrading endonuclease RelE of RelBE toxin-antitoxin system
MARQEPVFSPDAVRQFKKLRRYDRRIILDGVKTHLVSRPGQSSRQKFRLRRASEWADYELRLGQLRVFYHIDPSDLVLITLIGVKQGNTLIVEGEEFEL